MDLREVLRKANDGPMTFGDELVAVPSNHRPHSGDRTAIRKHGSFDGDLALHSDVSHHWPRARNALGMPASPMPSRACTRKIESREFAGVRALGVTVAKEPPDGPKDSDSRICKVVDATGRENQVT